MRGLAAAKAEAEVQDLKRQLAEQVTHIKNRFEDDPY